MASIVEFDEVVAEALRSAAGQGAMTLSGLDTLRVEMNEGRINDVVVLGPSIDQEAALTMAASYRVTHPRCERVSGRSSRRATWPRCRQPSDAASTSPSG
jgi:hypothetical protein